MARQRQAGDRQVQLGRSSGPVASARRTPATLLGAPQEAEQPGTGTLVIASDASVHTRGFPAARRAESWQDYICDQFIPLTVRPKIDGLRGSVAGSEIAETRLRRIRANEHLFERRPADIDAGDPEVLHALHIDSGRIDIEQDGRSAASGTGDLLLYDSSRPFRLTTSGPFQFTIGLVPKRLLPFSTPHLTARPSPPGDGVASALGALLSSLTSRQASAASAEQQMALQDALINLFVAHAAGGPSTTSPAEGHLAVAKLFIVRNLGNPDLAPADVADACGVSVSYLHRLFSGDGDTVAGYIRERRLAGAYKDLATGRIPERVAVVAGRWGIPDPAHFSRMFKNRFGQTPSDVRNSSSDTGMPPHER